MRYEESIAAARLVIEKGWPVFFVSFSKVPFKGSHGFLDATTDDAAMLALAQKYRGQMLMPAIALGPDEMVVDIDFRNGGTSESVGLDLPMLMSLKPGGPHTSTPTMGCAFRTGCSKA